MKIEIHPPLSIQEVGQRSNQEDSIAQLDNRLFVLCDGMGGHEKGEVASQTICQSLKNWFSEHVNSDGLFTDDMLKESIEYAYQELDKHDDGNPRKMGTTLTMLYIHREGITAAHIGDSRIYHIRPQAGVLYQSRDHSLAYDLYQSGEISYDEMLHFPQKNIVTRAMTPGLDNRMRPDIIHITDILPGDYFYLCSDGMLEKTDNDQLFTLFSSSDTDESKRKKLVDATVKNQDNHTAWLIHIKSVILEEGDGLQENEETTARCNALNIKPFVEDTMNTEVVVEADEEDVTMVSSPSRSHPNTFDSLKKYALAVITLLLVVMVAFFFLKPSPKSEPQTLKQKVPSKQERVQSKDSARKTNKKEISNNAFINPYDTAGNKQPVNAAERDNSPWYLPDR